MNPSLKSGRMIQGAPSHRPHHGRVFLAAALALSFTALGAPAEHPITAASLAEAVAAAQKAVEKVRGVPFKGAVASVLLPEKDLGKVLDKKLVEDLPTSFEKYATSLVALGLIEPQPDLQKRITRLYARQVAGFYDPKEKRFYIVPERASESSLNLPGLGVETGSLMTETLLTHELTHALQDARLDLARRIESLRESSDGTLALEAFLEGEATVVMTEALVAQLPEDARTLLGPDTISSLVSSLSSTSAIEGAEGVPEFFVKELVFPYAAGTAYIQHLKSAGGWAAVDEAYRHLPETTSEVLHPGRSFASRLRLSAADRPDKRDVPAGAALLYTDVLGEWILEMMLERAGAGESAAAIAADRQDDRVVFFDVTKGETKTVGFVWRIRCTSPAVARSLADALAPLYAGRPLPARPSLRVRGDVVEVSRGGKLTAGEASSPSAR